MQSQRFNGAFATARKSWHAPRVARLDAGSAEDGPSNNEDGSFSAS